MKKSLLIFIVMLFAFISRSQPNEAKAQKQIDYLQKSKQQRTTGLILLGGGAAFFAVGTYSLDHATEKNGSGAFMILGGMGMAVTSLPFFISSAFSKRKAKVLMRRETVMITPVQRSNITYSSISLRLTL